MPQRRPKVLSNPANYLTALAARCIRIPAFVWLRSLPRSDRAEKRLSVELATSVRHNLLAASSVPCSPVDSRRIP